MLTATDLLIRDAGPGDAEACGRIFYDAFAAIAHRHAFPVEPDSPEFTAFHATLMLSLDGIVCVVAERDGTVVGSGFADVRGPIAGIGPVSVDPAEPGRRHRPPADGGSARAHARRGRRPPRPDRLPRPLARSLREARVRGPRTALGTCRARRCSGACPDSACAPRARTTSRALRRALPSRPRPRSQRRTAERDRRGHGACRRTSGSDLGIRHRLRLRMARGRRRQPRTCRP